MLPRLHKIALAFGCVLYVAHAANTQGTQTSNTQKYYCPTNAAYKEYQSGKIKIESVPSFSTQASCEATCQTQRDCSFSPFTTNSVIVGDIKQDSPVDIDAINKKIASYPNILTLRVLVGGFEHYVLSDNATFSVPQLFKPLGPSDYKKTGYSASVSGNNVDIQGMAEGEQSQIAYVNGNTAMGYTQANGMVQAEHTTCKKVVNLTSAELDAAKDKYNKELEEYNKKISSGSIFGLTPPKLVTTKEVDSPCTKITKENGGTQTIDRHVALAPLVGITISSSNVSFFTQDINESGKTAVKNVSIKLQNGYGEEIIDIEGESNNIISVGSNTLTFKVIVYGDPKDQSNYSYAVTQDTSRLQGDFQIEIITQNLPDRYSCPFNSSLTGDLGQNAFSSEASCKSQCKVTTNCVTVGDSNNNGSSNCTIISSEFLSPVTDMNGNTMYLSRKVTKKCQVTTTKQTGCSQYQTTTTVSPNFENLLKGGIPTIQTNKKNHDFSKAVDVFGAASMAENMTHIFSGEHNYCDSGLFVDIPDWTVLIKYATMLAGPVADSISAGSSAYGATMEVAETSVTTGLKEAAKAGFKQFANNFTRKITKDVAEEIFKNLAISYATQITVAIGKEIFSEDKEKNVARQQAFATGTTEGILSNNELGGATDELDKVAVDYVTCMVGRFGITYQDILNYQMGTAEVTALHYAWKNPVLVTGEELAMLKKVMENTTTNDVNNIDKYFYARYNVEKSTGKVNGKTAYPLYSLKGEDLIVAAETICGGIDALNVIREKYAARFLDTKLAEPTAESEYPSSNMLTTKEEALPGLTQDSNAPSADNGFTLEDVGVKIAETLVGALPFPYNMAASLLVDLYDMLNEYGNTCTDMEFAEKRKDTEYITANKRISLGLCTKVATEELGKIGGKVTKKRHHYCCYDQQSTRIMAEGIQPQIGKSVSMNNCAPITVQDLNNVSFRSCKAGEDPKKNNCFPANKFAELTDAFMSGAQIGMDEAVKGVIDSMFNLNEATQQ